MGVSFRPRSATILAALLALLYGGPVAGAAAEPAEAAHRSGSRVTLDVLTYNVEGVPGRRGRDAQLAEIGRRLSDLRLSGEAPDVVLFQEVFSRSAKTGVRQSGYPEMTGGPTRKARRDLPRWGERSGRKWRKGELGLRLVGSGLMVASTHPVSVTHAQPFSRRACAGFDCLSNKGGLHVRIRVPGVPEEVEIFNTHMNAQGASGVRPARHMPIHRAQVLELTDFIEEARQPGNPIILGGDFNMRRSEDRFNFFQTKHQLQLVHRHCLENAASCDVRVSWDGDAPWLDTQDLQLFASGSRVSVRPISIEAAFDGRPDSPKLSDHDGLRVVYELSWDAD